MHVSVSEARTLFQSDRPMLERAGIIAHDAISYRADDWKHDWNAVPLDLLGMDAAPIPYPTVTPTSAGIPVFLSTTLDPNAVRVMFSTPGIGKILGEVKKGTWVDQTWMIPVIEHSGTVSTYGDYSEDGGSTANVIYPQRQSYHWQTFRRYGEREMDAYGLAKVNYANEVDEASATVMMQYQNWVYAVGVAGLQNYGILNDPALSAAIAPGVKTAGNGNVWMFGNQINATANEVYNDITALFTVLVNQTGGLVESDDELILNLAPISAVALKATNTFNVNVAALLKDNFPNIRIQTEVRYGAYSATNPQGNQAGSLVQLIAPKVQGQETGFSAYTERMRTFPIFRRHSAYEQKVVSGSWGTILRLPMAVATMVGV